MELERLILNISKKSNHSDLSLLPPKHVETHSFTRTKRIDQVLAKRQPNDATAGVTYSAWSADQTWSQVISPEIPGYYPREDIDATQCREKELSMNIY